MKIRRSIAAINGIYIMFIYIAVVWQTSKVDGNNCTKLLHRLGDSQMRYTYCTTINALPVTMCEECRDNYTKMRNDYIEVKAECPEYFDGNRSNLVTRGESVLEDIWTKAYCDDCLKNYADLWKKNTDFEDCTRPPAMDICFKCYVQYNSLNQLYLQLERDRKGHICFDIQDMMYLKRYQWTKVWNCSHQKSDLLLFIIVAVIVINLHIAFYGINYAIARRRERRTHNILNNNTDTDEMFDTPTTSTAVIPPALASAPATTVSREVDLLHIGNTPPSNIAASNVPIANII